MVKAATIFSVQSTVKVATYIYIYIYIYGRGSAVLSTKEGKSGFIYDLVKS